MPTGTVKWFNPTKGYGFIQPSGGGGKDVFVHISAVERAGLRSLNEGQTVEYEIQASAAKSLRPILGSSSGIGVFGLGRCKTNTQKVAILLMWP
jgi:CspA family cold shock protein